MTKGTSMKIAVISDTHNNLHNIQAVWMLLSTVAI